MNMFDEQKESVGWECNIIRSTKLENIVCFGGSGLIVLFCMYLQAIANQGTA